MSADRVLIIGATSAIATAVARLYARNHARLCLVGRRQSAIEELAEDLRVRGSADVLTCQLDLLIIDDHARILDEAWNAWGGFDRVLVAHGVLPDQAKCAQSVAATLEAFDINARSLMAIMVPIANKMESQGSGAVALISSPAGDRGRQSNYCYGAAKAAVTALASGLRHRLASKGVRVVTILPGFVDTPMTASLSKSSLWASSERVAKDIYRAIESGFGELYTPWFWGWIMFLIRHIPERIFIRMRL